MNPPRITSDGRSIDVAFEGGVARLDADDLEVRSRIPTDIDVSSILVEVPGTSEVVGSGSNGLVGRWDMAEGREVVRGRSPEPSMLSDVDVSPDGEIVAAYHLVTYALVLFDAATLAPVGLPLPTGDFVHAPPVRPRRRDPARQRALQRQRDPRARRWTPRRGWSGRAMPPAAT